MSISFPLTPPASPGISTIKWYEVNVIGRDVCPYNLKGQTFDWGAAGWGFDCSIDPCHRSEIQPWVAFLSALRGQNGTFIFGSEQWKSPLGAGGGTPRVNGASQTGLTLITDGWPNSTLVLKAGDMFAIDNRLYRNLTDATTNGSGQVTLDIWPYAKNHADNSVIVIDSPKGLFRLRDNSVITQDEPRSMNVGISFGAAEAL